MGLGKRERNSHDSLAARDWLLPLGVIAAATLCVIGGELARDWLRYDRAAIASGQIWRLASGHIVHLGWSHFALNTAGLGLVWYLVGGAFTLRNWAIVVMTSVTAIDLGFWLLNPELSWYVGLSGLLHGMLAAGLVATLSRRQPETIILAILLLAKLAYEQVFGPLPGSEASSGGTVIVDAHLYGAIGGFCGAAIALIRVRAAAAI